VARASRACAAMARTSRDGVRSAMPQSVVLNRGVRGGAERKIQERH
jgi:hypothetical protein